MKKIISILILGILLLSSGIGITANQNNGLKTRIETFSFDTPQIEDNEEFITVNVEQLMLKLK